MISVYISGPITGTVDYMERFKEAEEKLRKAGYDPVNPAEINSHLPEDTSWETYMGQSLKLLCNCDAIYLMRNWIQSRGAKIEQMVAQAMDKEVVEL